MKLIQLTQGYEAMIDDEDYDRVNMYNWYARTTSWTIYAWHDFRNKARTKGKNMSLHEFILHTPPVGFTIDHKDRDGLNCQKYNLRIADGSQQQANTSSNKIGYRGVHFKGNGWQALLTYKGKQYYGGSYITEIEAAIAYDNMAMKYHGEFATLNFPINKEVKIVVE